MSARIPPVEKLPLPVRRSFRDDFESRIPEFAEELSNVMGTRWTIDIDPRVIYPNAEPGSWAHDSLGDCIAEYVKDAMYHVRNLPSSHGDHGINEINSLAHQHILSMDIDDQSPARFDSCGAEFRDGRLFILITPGKLGTNSGEAFSESNLEMAMNQASPHPGAAVSQMSYSVRKGINSDYSKGIEDIKAKIQRILKRENIAFVPNFEDTAAQLQAERAKPSPQMRYPDRWERLVGSFTLQYFQGVEDGLSRQGFSSHEMLQEGFNEAVSSGQIAFRLVDRLTYSSDCEVAVEQGVLYVQTTVQEWGSNMNDCARNLVDQL